MRKINDKNQIWFDESEDGVRIGFTQSFLDTLDQCWHILPSNTEKFKLKAPLLTVETNDALISIMSPVAGNFMHYSDKAQNFPDRLVEADIIMELSHKHQVVQQQVGAVAAALPQDFANFVFPNVRANRVIQDDVINQIDLRQDVHRAEDPVPAAPRTFAQMAQDAARARQRNQF